jgi:hypothetical protein
MLLFDFVFGSLINIRKILSNNPDGCEYPFAKNHSDIVDLVFCKRYCKPAGIGLIEMPKPFVSDNFNIVFLCFVRKLFINHRIL